MCPKNKSPLYDKAKRPAPQATQATVAISPQQREIIPHTKPPIATPLFSVFLLPIAPKIIARTPQIEPIQPMPIAPTPIETINEIIPRINDATAMLHLHFIFMLADFTFNESTLVTCQLNIYAILDKNSEIQSACSERNFSSGNL